MKLDYVAHSEIGLVRKNNQDSGYASPTMLVVADGMGGAAAGDLASAVAVDELRRADNALEPASHADRLAEAVTAANAKIAALADDDESLDGMGTTVCGGMFDGETFSLIHIGDSRAYLQRDGELKRLTTDHTWVQSLVDEGKITAEDALYHPHRSLLLKVVNGHPASTCDTEEITLQEGDRLLFCSDGLCGLVEDGPIAEGMRHARLDDVLDELVELAHEAGGLDNITLVVADVVADDAPAPKQPLLLGAATEVDIPVVHADPRAALAATSAAPQLVEDPEDARYRPIPKPRRRRWWWLLALLVALGLLAAGSMAASRVINARYYVGTDGQAVAIYRGIPDKLGPIGLSSKLETTSVQVADLPPRYAEQVRQNFYKGLTLEAVRSTVGELDKRAEQCVLARRARAQQTQTPAPTPAASATTPPPATPGAKPTATVGPTVPTPTASSSPTPPPPPEEC